MKTLKKKDLVAVLLDEYRHEMNDRLYWYDAKKRSAGDTVLDYDYIIAEHTNRAYALQVVLQAYGYSVSELVRIEFSDAPI